MSMRILLRVYICLGFIGIASSNCFWIDGTVAKGHTPCYDLDTVGASMCCARDSFDFSSCTPGGLCVYNHTEGAQGPYDNDNSVWRESCSDPTWKDAACLAMAPYITHSDVRLNQCADGSYCPRTYDDVNETCCTNHQGQSARNFGATLPASTTTASLSVTSMGQSVSTTSATSADVSPPSSTTSPTPTPFTNGGDGTSKTEKVAVIVGSIVGVATLVSALVFGINGWKKRNIQQSQL